MDNDRVIKKEFFAITRILPLHRTNLPQDSQIRKDQVFSLLADKVFDHPGLLKILLKMIKKWLVISRSEFVYCLAGYIYYLYQDFRKAEFYFFRAIEKNPRNLDSWFDLAFSLYHQDKTKHELAKNILFNFDNFIDHYAKLKFKSCNLNTIRKLSVKDIWN